MPASEAGVTSLFTMNLFHMLGIRATTDVRWLRRLIDDRRIQFELGVDRSGLTDESLRSFRQTVEAPNSRIGAEIFAFHSVDPTVAAEQLPFLRDRAQTATGLERTLLYHDIAVAAHLAWAQSDSASAAAVDALRVSLSAWRPVVREPEFWQYLAARAEGTRSADELWRECVAVLIGSVVQVAADLLSARNLGPGLGVIGVLRDAALP